MQAKHQTLIQLWDEYRDQLKSAAYSYSQFTYYYREFLSKIDITMRQIHYAGDCIFVDFAGQTIPWFDATQSKQCEAQVFVAAQGCSNYLFAYACASQKSPDWIEAHNRMFQFYGGVPKTVIYDYVARHIIRLLFPSPLCGTGSAAPGMTGGRSSRGAHKNQRESSHFSKSTPRCQAPAWEDAAED